jgi:hypothetical protein
MRRRRLLLWQTAGSLPRRLLWRRRWPIVVVGT